MIPQNSIKRKTGGAAMRADDSENIRNQERIAAKGELPREGRSFDSAI
jgi:hypothetical protein